MQYNIVNGDLGYWFRGQGSRSMDQLDDLVQYKLSVQSKLDEAKIK